MAQLIVSELTFSVFDSTFRLTEELAGVRLVHGVLDNFQKSSVSKTCDTLQMMLGLNVIRSLPACRFPLHPQQWRFLQTLNSPKTRLVLATLLHLIYISQSSFDSEASQKYLENTIIRKCYHYIYMYIYIQGRGDGSRLPLPPEFAGVTKST